jgi:aspartyl-tRNA(Asn)/glutamyl-tRNA(Gln) amidotransferase subunit B
MLNTAGIGIEKVGITPAQLVDLLALLQADRISANSAKQVLREMLTTGAEPQTIINEHRLEQVTDTDAIKQAVESVLAEHPDQVESFLAGKDTLAKWFFGQVMRSMEGKANPRVVHSLLNAALKKEVDTSDNL